MSEFINAAIRHIEQAPYALLITISEDNKPTVREIGPFVNDGLTLYIVTHKDSQKVKQFGIHPDVTFYFPNTSPEPKEFKSVAITGTTEFISGEAEVNSILDELSKKSPFYKEYIVKEGLDIWGAYKFTANSLQITDYASPVRTMKIDLP